MLIAIFVCGYAVVTSTTVPSIPWIVAGLAADAGLMRTQSFVQTIIRCRIIRENRELFCRVEAPA